MDYKDFEKKPKKAGDPADNAESKAGYWWKETDPQTRATALQRAAEALDQDQGIRHAMNLLHARLYGNFDFSGFGAREYMRGSVAASSKIAYNVVEAGTDTLASKISKHRPRARCSTNGAKWSEQRKGKRLEGFIDGSFQYADVYGKDDLVFIDACVFGDGGYKVFIDDNGKVNVERVFVDEILVDEADAKYGKPRQMIQGLLCHKEKLIAEYPDYAQQIRDAKSPENIEMAGFGDMVQVWEAWHLPSKKKAKDGLHCIVLDDGCELYCEPWKLDRFPFVFFQFKPRLLGFWGQGVAEILTGIQISLNRLVRSVDEQIRRKGKGRVFMPLSAKVPPEHLTNGIGDIVYFNGGVPPVVDNSNAVAREEVELIHEYWQKAFQVIGASEMSVSAKKPAGLDAGVALREFEEIESERFAKVHQRWDRFHMKLAELLIMFVDEFGGEDYVTTYEHKKYMETIKYGDCKLEPGEYKISMVPSSSLPGTPASKRQAIKEMMADGFIDKATAQQLLDMPDLDTENNLGNAAINDVDATIEEVLETGEVEAPDKFTSLELLVERGTAAYLFAKQHKADEDKLAALGRLVDLAAAKMVAAQVATPPGPGPMPPPGPVPPPEMPSMQGPPGPVGPPGPPIPAVPPNVV